LPLREQGDQECVCLKRVPHGTPIDKGLLGLVHQIEALAPREATGRIVVCLVARLLEINERRRNGNQFWLERQPVEGGLNLERHAIVRKTLGGVFHLSVRKGTPEGLTQTRPIASSDKTCSCLVYEEVEERVVGCRDGAAEAGVLRAAGLPSGKMTSLAEKIRVEAHCSLNSEEPRKRT